MEIAQLPSERKMWILRRFYAGGKGALPPTDPRLLEMTPLLMDIDFAHMRLDKIESGDGNAYEDDEYDKFDQESDEIDDRLSEMPTFGSEATDPHAGISDTPSEVAEIPDDEWEEVERDPSTPE